MAVYVHMGTAGITGKYSVRHSQRRSKFPVCFPLAARCYNRSMIDAQAATREVTLVGEHNCPLCDSARDELHSLREELQFQLRELDADDEPALRERYQYVLPVVCVGGMALLSGRFSTKDLYSELRRAFGPDPLKGVPAEEEQFLPLLECPVCEGDLESRPRAVACLRCNREYARVDGVLLLMAAPEIEPRFGLLDRLGRLIGFKLRD